MNQPLTFMHGAVERLEDLVAAMPVLRTFQSEVAAKLSPDDRRRLAELVEELPGCVEDAGRAAKLVLQTARSARELIKKPVAAYVEQVYEYGDFAALGIGV